MSQEKKIRVIIKNVYGTNKIYPADEDAKTFAAILNQKTLTEWDISLIKRLGYEIEVVPRELQIINN